MDPLAGLEQLERRYARLLGELRYSGRREAEAKLNALRALIQANFDPLWDAHHIEPIQPVRRYDAEAIHQALRAVLSPTEPQTTRQLARRVIERLSDRSPTEQEVRNVDRKVRTALEGDLRASVDRTQHAPAAWVSRSLETG